MEIPAHNERRAKPRVSVTLKAAVSFAGHESVETEALISNLSVTGARLHLEKSGPLGAGRGITVKIAIPDTVLRHTAEAEILWVERQHSAVSLGIRFNEPLSAFMMKRLVER